MTTPIVTDRATEQVAEWLASTRCSVAFTGAGISIESGIPDFRSPGGIWSKSQPVYFDEFLRSAAARQEYWRQKVISHRDFADAKPNVGHTTLARREAAERIRGVITQNIDGLHQIAGNRRVLELHGTAREVACLGCNWRADADPLVSQFLATERVPDCPVCGGLLKHATIAFGKNLPAAVLDHASSWAVECDLFLAIGSSLVVHPAAGLPALAKESGARRVILNRDETPLDGIADAVIRGSIGETLRQVDEVIAIRSN
jgi:NAD-dependent deacetylase